MQDQISEHTTTIIDRGRRRFVTGIAVGGALAGIGLACKAFAAKPTSNGPPELRGRRFDLSIDPTLVDFTGKPGVATAVNGSVPAPLLRWKEGDRVTLNVTNNLAEDSSIHWHGIILPSEMDGVPGISNDFHGIKPGETFHYSFDVAQSGTYWYHSHSGFQEQTGTYGPIVIDPIEPEPFAYDRDYVVMLSDWSDENPVDLYHKLKKLSHYYNFRERTVGELFSEIREKGIRRVWNERAMWNDMRMSDRDISDVTGYTYTFLMNGHAPAEGWTGLFRRGEKVRLRFINGAAMTFFDVCIPGLTMTVVAADGQYVQPVSVDEFRIGVAETYDVIVEPKDDRAYAVFAQAIDRSGYAFGNLTPDPALRADVPPMDPAPILTHADMGMGMMHMGHGGMKHDMSAMGHDMSSMGHDMAGMSSGNRPAMGNGKAGFGSSQPVRHARTEYGPQVDMRADGAAYRLDDPGVGLRGLNRKILTYADLFNLNKTPDPREPEREIQLHLTGNMSRYMWSVDGVKFADAEPLRFKFGERLRITLVNDTMMNHPIHLHGLWSDLETGDPEHIPRKHTVIVQPGAKVSYLVTADAMGGWAYHCHLLYHMLGMFRKVEVV